MKMETSQVANELIKRLDTHLNDENIGNPFFLSGVSDHFH